MARTNIWQMHARKRQTVAKCIELKIGYAINPEKTDGGRLVSAYGCDPDFAAAEFAVTKRTYRQRTGFEQEREVAAYNVLQSFYRGEITPEEANRIGYELAMRMTHGEFAFVVGTHTDRLHVHNHIVWNSTSTDGTKKYFDYPRSKRDVRRVSDQICSENGLVVIEDPKRPDAGGAKKPLRRDAIRSAIDDALRAGPKDFGEFAEILRKAGLKVRSGEHTEVKLPGEKEYIRLDSLGEGYTEEDIRKTLDIDSKPLPISGDDGPAIPKRIPLLSELETKIGSGRGEAYERVMKVVRLKQMADTLVYMEEHGFESLEQLSGACADSGKRLAELGRRIKETESEIREKRNLRRHTDNYRRTGQMWKEYRESGWSEDYRAEHETDIILRKAAADYFKEHGLTKLPGVKKLDEEISRLLQEKKTAYREYREIQKESEELETHRANAEHILNIAYETEIERENVKGGCSIGE